jgi:hypothetical protein
VVAQDKLRQPRLRNCLFRLTIFANTPLTRPAG